MGSSVNLADTVWWGGRARMSCCECLAASSFATLSAKLLVRMPVFCRWRSACLYDFSAVPAGEVNEENEAILVAKGGDGGGPFNGYSAQTGQRFRLALDLKLLSDVALIGCIFTVLVNCASFTIFVILFILLKLTLIVCTDSKTPANRRC